MHPQQPGRNDWARCGSTLWHGPRAHWENWRASRLSGHDLSYADCAAYGYLPVVSSASRAVPGADALASVAGIADYLKFIAARPYAQRVSVERRLESFAASHRRA